MGLARISLVKHGAPGRIRTCAPASGGRMTGLSGPSAAYLNHIWSNSGCRQPLRQPQFHSTNHSTGPAGVVRYAQLRIQWRARRGGAPCVLQTHCCLCRCCYVSAKPRRSVRLLVLSNKLMSRSQHASRGCQSGPRPHHRVRGCSRPGDARRPRRPCRRGRAARESVAASSSTWLPVSPSWSPPRWRLDRGRNACS